jgi:hypothetical protein
LSCLSVRMEELGFNWTDFHEIWYLNIFRKSLEKIQVSLKSGSNNGTLHEDEFAYLIISRSVILRKKLFRTKVVEKINTHILRSVAPPHPPPPEDRAVYEKLWNSVAERGRRLITIWSIRIACLITRATDTHSECVILIAFHCNKGQTNAPQFYVVRTLPGLFNVEPSGT